MDAREDPVGERVHAGEQVALDGDDLVFQPGCGAAPDSGCFEKRLAQLQHTLLAERLDSGVCKLWVTKS